MLAASAAATTHVVVDDALLTDRADLVARVEVAASAVDLAEGLVMTAHHLDVVEVYKGAAGGSRIVVRVPGGRVEGAGVALRIEGLPELVPGQEALLFLRERPDGTYRLLHLAQGLFHPARDFHERVWLRALETEAPFGVTARSASTVRHGERFERWIADRAAGLRRPADYFLDAGPGALAMLPSFVLLDFADFDQDGKGDLTRWLEFDEGRRVVWKRHRAGLPGITQAQTRRKLKQATRAWNTRTMSPIKLRSRGKTASTSSFLVPDGLNTVLFEDIHDLMGPFSCPGGGTVGLGAVWVVTAPKVPWKGGQYFPAVEAEININDEAECLFAGNPEVAAEVFTHELGHTLGIAHPCGDGRRSPKCKDVVADATMAPILHDDGRGAALRYDDVLAARYVYDPLYDAAWCRKKARPGGRKYCRRCGPCGEGQGHCRNDNQCLPGLVCVEGAGEPIGFPPGTALCLPAEPAP